MDVTRRFVEEGFLHPYLHPRLKYSPNKHRIHAALRASFDSGSRTMIMYYTVLPNIKTRMLTSLAGFLLSVFVRRRTVKAMHVVGTFCWIQDFL